MPNTNIVDFKKFFFTLLLVLGGISQVYSQNVPKPELSARLGANEIIVTVQLSKDWHITAHNPVDEFAFGAEVEIPQNPIDGKQVIWPQPVVKFIESIGMENSYYQGSFQVIIPFKSLKDGKKISGQELVFHYQSCTQELCLAPAQVSTLIW